LCLALVGWPFLAPALIAEVTVEQRKELTELKRELGKVTSLIRDKSFDEAEKLLSDSEEMVNAIATAAQVQPTDRSMQGVAVLIQRHRESLAKARARVPGTQAAAGVSFSKQIAPLFNEKCLGCHGASNPRANLRLDTFAGWKRGGQSGPLLVAGNANASRLIARVRDPDASRRMPRNGDPLTADELQTLGTWINQGAKFDGQTETATLEELIAAADLADDPTVLIPKPTGNETVSFTRDIAPFMANLCGNCHSRARRSGGLCLETFYDMMKGGDSGRVVLPGNLEGSRLYRLVGGLENPRMPQGQARITRKNYEDLTKWFEEGCVYDGDDPRTPLRQFVRTEAAVEAERFASMSAEEMNKFRIERTDGQIKRALPNDATNSLQSDEFYLIGNVGAERLRQVDEWAQAHAANLRKSFSGGSGQLWKGRLALFVLKDRFSYDEFNQTIDGREAPPEMTGHSVVTASSEDAYVALLDIGDEATVDKPALRVNLIDHLTGAYFKRGGSQAPDWVLRGTGLAMAAQALPGDPYLRQLDGAAAQQVATLGRPEDVFANGTFSPGTIAPVGYSLVNYMIDAGGAPKYAQFVRLLTDGRDVASAVRGVYNTDLAALARGYVGAVARKGR
jgi:hypothetical protein